MVTFAVTNTYGVCLRSFWRQTTWPLCTSARFAVMVAFALTNTYGVFANFGATYVLALLGFQYPVSGVACARLGPRFRVFWRQTAWLLCTSARSAIVLEGCHSMVTFTVTNTYDVCSRDFWRQTAWPLCASARSTVVFEECHSMVTLAVTNAGGVCSRGFWRQTK